MLKGREDDPNRTKEEAFSEVSEQSEEHIAPQERREKKRDTALTSLRCCLFCNHTNVGIKKCLDHMRLKHNFIILDIDCLISIKSLLSYLAEKIHLGNMCIMCNKEFGDFHSTQSHMVDKGHCFMNVDDFETEYAGKESVTKLI